MAYIESLKGYIIDVPELFLERNDGQRFHFNQITTSNVTPDTQFMEVNAGWALLPVAYLPKLLGRIVARLYAISSKRGNCIA